MRGYRALGMLGLLLALSGCAGTGRKPAWRESGTPPPLASRGDEKPAGTEAASARPRSTAEAWAAEKPTRPPVGIARYIPLWNLNRRLGAIGLFKRPAKSAPEVLPASGNPDEKASASASIGAVPLPPMVRAEKPAPSAFQSTSAETRPEEGPPALLPVALDAPVHPDDPKPAAPELAMPDAPPATIEAAVPVPPPVSEPATTEPEVVPASLESAVPAAFESDVEPQPADEKTIVLEHEEDIRIAARPKAIPVPSGQNTWHAPRSTLASTQSEPPVPTKDCPPVPSKHCPPIPTRDCPPTPAEHCPPLPSKQSLARSALPPEQEETQAVAWTGEPERAYIYVPYTYTNAVFGGSNAKTPVNTRLAARPPVSVPVQPQVTVPNPVRPRRVSLVARLIKRIKGEPRENLEVIAGCNQAPVPLSPLGKPDDVAKGGEDVQRVSADRFDEPAER
jgi:hypothetical protein